MLGVEFIRFDMTEYMEKHTVSRLIGAPPGYVGFDQGGLLTDAIRKHPYAVVLLDEIEKAHPDLFNILLQVMDHATLTDNNGRKSDFRNVILIMTTNAGAREMAARHASASATRSRDSKDGKKALERMFTPEFRNRLDATVFFDALPVEVIRKVARKFLDELDGQLAEKKVAARGQRRPRSTGSSSTATTRRWARGRWRGWSRTRSRRRSRTRSCSASWRTAASRTSTSRTARLSSPAKRQTRATSASCRHRNASAN